jgi:hypothetical protein
LLAQAPGGNGSNQHKIKVQYCTLVTSEQRAAASGASIRTQKMADKVAKASPELVEAMDTGKLRRLEILHYGNVWRLAVAAKKAGAL